MIPLSFCYANMKLKDLVASCGPVTVQGRSQFQDDTQIASAPMRPSKAMALVLTSGSLQLAWDVSSFRIAAQKAAEATGQMRRVATKGELLGKTKPLPKIQCHVSVH